MYTVPGRDNRYDIADEYLEVVYKLREGSWEDDAVVRDVERGIYADPDRVHPIGHDGSYYRVPGIHMSKPSPQRTPVLYQARSCPRRPTCTQPVLVKTATPAMIA